MTSRDAADAAAMAGVSSLDDPLRRRLYEQVADADQPVSREQAAAAAGIGRTLAAYHLDKLVESGLLTTSYARPTGRRGPGAGRPAKLYAATDKELSVTVPPRDYALLARLLADAVQHDDSGAVRTAVADAAYQAGQDTGAAGGDLRAALHSGGYRPADSDSGEVELRNCPFHRLAREHTELVCGLNLQLVQGVLSGLGLAVNRAVLRPRPGRCCVVISPAG